MAFKPYCYECRTWHTEDEEHLVRIAGPRDTMTDTEERDAAEEIYNSERPSRVGQGAVNP